MPESHRNFTVTITGKVPASKADDLSGAVGSFVTGLGAGEGINAIINSGGVEILPLPQPVGAASVGYGAQYGSDVILTIPDYDPEEGILYLLLYSDDALTTFSDVGYTPSPNAVINHANGYQSGRQYVIFADDTPGTSTTALP